MAVDIGIHTEAGHVAKLIPPQRAILRATVTNNPALYPPKQKPRADGGVLVIRDRLSDPDFHAIGR